MHLWLETLANGYRPRSGMWRLFQRPIGPLRDHALHHCALISDLQLFCDSTALVDGDFWQLDMVQFCA